MYSIHSSSHEIRSILVLTLLNQVPLGIKSRYHRFPQKSLFSLTKLPLVSGVIVDILPVNITRFRRGCGYSVIMSFISCCRNPAYQDIDGRRLFLPTAITCLK